MKRTSKIISVVILAFLISSISTAQDNSMMKKDSMKTKMMSKNKMMGKKDMMGKDKMMNDNSMMKDHMFMKIDKNMDGIAIKGYDPVAYFTDSKAMMGDKMYSYKWNGATWQFENENHLKMFKNNPEKYTPSYGGYCVFGVSHNKLSSTDPTAWRIVDGKLYLMTNAKVEKMFDEDVKDNIKKADMNWPELNKKDKM